MLERERTPLEADLARLASLRRLYHHVVHGGTLRPWDAEDTGLAEIGASMRKAGPPALKNLAEQIVELERRTTPGAVEEKTDA